MRTIFEMKFGQKSDPELIQRGDPYAEGEGLPQFTKLHTYYNIEYYTRQINSAREITIIMISAVTVVMINQARMINDELGII